MDFKKIRKGLIYHFIDTTAMGAAVNPVLSALEVTLYRMTDQISLNARLFGYTVGYLGLGLAVSKGRDFSKRKFEITDKKTIRLHDAAYMIAFNSVFAPTSYLISGEPDSKKFAIGVGVSMVISPLLGIGMGYFIDLFRDLTGLEKSERVPDLVRRQKPSIKKGLAAIITAASIASIVGIYSLTPDKSIGSSYEGPVVQGDLDIGYSHPL